MMKNGMRLQRNLFLIQVVGTAAIPLIMNKKLVEITATFSMLVTDLSDEPPPQSLHFRYFHPCHRSQTGLFGEQNRPYQATNTAGGYEWDVITRIYQ